MLARNVRLGSLELDIVARRRDLVVVVEARTRGPGSMLRALESVSRAKRTRLRRAVARLWSGSLRRMPGVGRVRIDVAAVTFSGRGVSIEYIDGALGP